MVKAINRRYWIRMLSWNAGWLILGWAWLGPLPWESTQSFAAHMTLHMCIVAIAAPLLSIAVAGKAFDPVLKWPYYFSPIIASLGELVLVWAWHTPRLHHWAQFSTIGFIFEQASFLSVGLWMWLSAFGGRLPRSKDRCGAGVIGLLLTSMHMTFLGALLAVADRPLFAHALTESSSKVLEDQQLGGVIMLVIGGIVFLTGGLYLVIELLSNTFGAATIACQNSFSKSPDNKNFDVNGMTAFREAQC